MIDILQTISSIFGLLFLFLIIKEKRTGWIFGIIATSISVYLFIHSKLYSESILYSYYVILGFYGWFNWSKPKIEKFVSINSIKKNICYILLAVPFAFCLGWIMYNYTDANYSYHDSFSTTYAFLATWLQAEKKLDSWIYWIFINIYSVFLYASADLDIKSIEMIIYAVFSFYGFFAWRKSYKSSIKQ